jgi:hypothetical protein
LQENGDFAHTLRDCLENGTPSRWEAFIHLAQPVVAAAVVQTLARWGHLDRQGVGDLIQDVFLKICANDFRVLRNIPFEALTDEQGQYVNQALALDERHRERSSREDRTAYRTIVARGPHPECDYRDTYCRFGSCGPVPISTRRPREAIDFNRVRVARWESPICFATAAVDRATPSPNKARMRRSVSSV